MLPSIVWISVLDGRKGVKVSKHINGLNKEKFEAHTLKIRNNRKGQIKVYFNFVPTNNKIQIKVII